MNWSHNSNKLTQEIMPYNAQRMNNLIWYIYVPRYRGGNEIRHEAEVLAVYDKGTPLCLIKTEIW